MDGEDHRQLLRDLRNYLESGSQPHGIINISRSMERQYDIFAPLNTEAITHPWFAGGFQRIDQAIDHYIANEVDLAGINAFVQ